MDLHKTCCPWPHRGTETAQAGKYYCGSDSNVVLLSAGANKYLAPLFSLTNEPSPVVDHFPPTHHYSQQRTWKNPGLRHALDFLTEGFTNSQPGSKLLLDKLTEIMLIQLIRTEFSTENISNFWRALFENQISEALMQWHNNPAHHWTLDSLWKQIGTSRTTLANRFKELAGHTVFDYLTSVRLQKVCDLLERPVCRCMQLPRNAG